MEDHTSETFALRLFRFYSLNKIMITMNSDRINKKVFDWRIVQAHLNSNVY